MRSPVLPLALAAFLIACAGGPRPASEGGPAASRLFSPSAKVRGIVLALDDRGVGAPLAERALDVITTEIQRNRRGVELVHEREIAVFRDVGSRRPLLGEGRNEDLGRVARKLGADLVIAGWAGRQGSRWAFDVRLVNAEGRVLNHAAGVAEGEEPSALIGRVRRAAGFLLEPDPPAAGEAQSPPELAAALGRRRGFFEACVAEGVMSVPALSGRAAVTLTVAPAGTVSFAAVETSTFRDRGLEACLRGAAESLVLPAGAAAPTPLSWSVVLPLPAPAGEPAAVPEGEGDGDEADGEADADDLGEDFPLDDAL